MLRFAWNDAVLSRQLDQRLSLRMRRVFDDPALDQSYPSFRAITVGRDVYVAYVPLQASYQYRPVSHTRSP